MLWIFRSYSWNRVRNAQYSVDFCNTIQSHILSETINYISISVRTTFMNATMSDTE